MNKLIVGFGEALVDVLPSGEVIGGAPLNFAVRAAQLAQSLGWSAALISRIGSDERGEKILHHLQQTSLDTSTIQIDGVHPTGFVDITLDHGQPSYVIGQRVAWDHITPDENCLNLSRRASAFCFGTLSQRSTQTIDTLTLCLAIADQAVKIFDINLRKPYPPIELIEACLKCADILKCNVEELLLLANWLGLHQSTAQVQSNAHPEAQHSNSTAARNIATELQVRFDLRGVFWTQGAEGCVLQRGQLVTTAEVPQFPMAPDADAVGAGDAAAAALAVGLVANWPDAKIVAVANHCGAFAASQRGATIPFPEDFLKQLLAI